MKKLFSTILVICSLLGGNAYAEKKIEFKWSIATSVASKHIYTFYQDGSCDEESHLIIGGCSWVKDGNKVIMSMNSGDYILNANVSFFGKVKGSWRSQSKNNPTGTIWGKVIK
jgi:hypothetical protein|tara:strand:+ start:197 stop:535 length:339 start_codon:yes stop_codon:yes gene_type:complete